MFEKLITDLKKSLPESLRKKLGGADNSDDEQEFEEVETESNETPVENSEEEKKKKMKSMIIKVIVILGLGYFALDEFVLKGMQQESETDIFAQAPKPKRKKAVEAEVTTDATPPADTTVSSETITPPVEPETTTASVSEEISTPPASQEPAVSEAPPIENINVLEKTSESAPTEPVAQEEQPPVQAQQEEQVISETRIGESSADQKLDQLVENVEQTAPSNPIEEVKIPSSNETTTAPSMASKIVEGITETAPPAYDQVGRGLVYNCKDKYWACLDKPAYVTCNKNQKWNKSKGNAAECAVADIYSSEEDCAKVQKYNVSTNASTAFCKN